MRVSFDLDDTAWKYREFFRELAHSLKARGHEVGACTGHRDDSREADQVLWLARGFPPMDFLLNADDGDRAGLGALSGGVCGGGPSQRAWKLALAKQHGVHAHFDDFGSGAGGDIILACLMRDEGAE